AVVGRGGLGEDIVTAAHRAGVAPGAIAVGVGRVNDRGPAGSIVARFRKGAIGRSGLDHQPAMVVPDIAVEAVGRDGALGLIDTEGIALVDASLVIVEGGGLRP